MKDGTHNDNGLDSDVLWLVLPGLCEVLESGSLVGETRGVEGHFLTTDCEESWFMTRGSLLVFMLSACLAGSAPCADQVIDNFSLSHQRLCRLPTLRVSSTTETHL